MQTQRTFLPFKSRVAQLGGGIGWHCPSWVRNDRTWKGGRERCHTCVLLQEVCAAPLRRLCFTFKTNLYTPWWVDLIKLPKVKLVSKRACSPPVKTRTTHTHFWHLLIFRADMPHTPGGVRGIANITHTLWNKLAAHVGTSWGASVPITCLKVCLCSQEFKRLHQPPSSSLSTASVSRFQTLSDLCCTAPQNY